MMMKETALRKFGFSEREIRIYLALLELDEATASSISKSTGMPRTLVYDILESLITKGVASHVIKSGRKYFSGLHPKNLVEHFESLERERKELLAKALPELLGLRKKGRSEKPKVEVYEGKDGVKSLFGDILRVGKEFLCFGSTGLSPEIIPYDLARFHRARINRKIPWRVIYNDDEPGRKRGKEVSGWKHTQVKFMEKTSPTTTYCYGSKIGIVVWAKERLLAVIIEDEVIAKSFREFFKLLWRSAHK
ncbi:MAG: TrmB family transcriptional regulator [Candidatus Diapherotrites archaeon]|uniref:TrmB family transcriptional regulator n=1 Tax=Candidatus Iainarchaeum sp. TaxID=3101447 RepID=A0A8T3YKL1_9ARCH|nr:TrmB family transcriptional regulator [Candidatus Diapherotrites archaeon]